MKPVRVMSTAALFLLFGIAAPANGSQEKPEEKAPPPKQEPKAKTEKQEQAKAPKQEQEAKPEKQQQAKAAKQEQAKPEKQQQQAKTQQQQAHQQQVKSSHAPQRTQEAIAAQRAQPALRLSARGSGRIPDDRFRASFGRAHDFHMGNPVLVGGYSRFQYGGFWFGFV